MQAQSLSPHAQLLTTEEAAARLRLSRPMVQKLARVGRLPFIQYTARGHLRFRATDVDQLLEQRQGAR